MRLPRDQLARVERLAKQNGVPIRKVKLCVPEDPGPLVAPGSPGTCVLVLDDYLPPLLNDLVRGRRRDGLRAHKACRDVVVAAARRQRLPAAIGCRRVRVEVTFPTRRHLPDPDALSKSLGDALKHAHLLIDDNYFGVEWAPVVYYVGDRLRTEVHLEDIPAKEVGPRPNGS